MRGDSDLSNIQSSHVRLKEHMEQVQRDNVALEEKDRQHTTQLKVMTTKFKNAKEEVRTCLMNELFFSLHVCVITRWRITSANNLFRCNKLRTIEMDYYLVTM